MSLTTEVIPLLLLPPCLFLALPGKFVGLRQTLLYVPQVLQARDFGDISVREGGLQRVSLQGSKALLYCAGALLGTGP